MIYLRHIKYFFINKNIISLLNYKPKKDWPEGLVV